MNQPRISTDISGPYRRPAKLLSGCMILLFVMGVLGCNKVPGCNKSDSNASPKTAPVANEKTPEGRSTPKSKKAKNSAGGDAGDVLSGKDAGEEEKWESSIRSPIPEERAFDAAKVRAIRARMGVIPPLPLEIDDLVRVPDIRSSTSYGGALDKQPLPGVIPTKDHNGVLFAAEDSLGVAMELWEHNSRNETEQAYEDLRKSLLAGQKSTLGSRSATLSTFANIHQIVVPLPNHHKVLSISCSQKFCTSEQLKDLTATVIQRL